MTVSTKSLRETLPRTFEVMRIGGVSGAAIKAELEVVNQERSDAADEIDRLESILMDLGINPDTGEPYASPPSSK